ncbi:MAG: AAA family ATPase [Gammaproteobacteria bacterium]|nr:AAA family ATPase [Gammaproteobacteria bacterium]
MAKDSTLIAQPEFRDAKRDLDEVVRQCGLVVLGKQQRLRLALSCMVAGGHLLIEDIPGVGKTTMAHALACAFGLKYQRIQFTSDLLPADILGAAIFDKKNSEFVFQAGPIFNQLILADEVNRTTPKTQSALLEAMEEQQVTVEGNTHPLPDPFFVIATQNPSHQTGTFPLPESQLDRFLMRLSLGYPDREAERQLLTGEDRRQMLDTLPAVMPPARLLELQRSVIDVHIAEPLLDYVQKLLAFSRADNRFVHGLSPRAGLGLVKAARAWALVDGRSFVIPEDVQSVLTAVVGHRLSLKNDANATSEAVANLLIENVDIL